VKTLGLQELVVLGVAAIVVLGLDSCRGWRWLLRDSPLPQRPARARFPGGFEHLLRLIWALLAETRGRECRGWLATLFADWSDQSLRHANATVNESPR